MPPPAAIVDRIDWPCEVTKDFADVNLGEVARIPQAISRVLDAMGEAIIIEDDCIPVPSFFRYCDDLLDHYRDDERVMSITGFSPLGRRATPYSYTFARSPVANGSWATWQRAWRHYDYDVTLWPMLRDTRWLQDLVAVPQAAALWRAILDGDVSPSDYGLRWVFNCWTQSGFGIVPATNLIRNIGFGPDATRMRKRGAEFFAVPAEEMAFPLDHPPLIARDLEHDECVWNFMFSVSPLARRRGSRLRRVASSLLN